MGFMDFVGSAAQTGSAIMGRQNEIDARGAEQERLARVQSELDSQREKVRLEMADKFATQKEERLRTRSASEGQTIKDDSDKSYRERIAGLINQKQGSSMTEEDAKSIASNPEAIKAYGLIGRTPAQELDDQIASAKTRGFDSKTQELRQEQGVQIRREDEARKEKKDDANTVIQNKRLDQQLKIQMAQLSNQMQHNRALEKSASDAAKISPAARAQLGMEESRLDAARQRLSLAVTQSKNAASSMDPIAIKEANDAIAAAQSGITASLESYNAIGKGHFGDQWISKPKDEPPQKQDVTVAGKVIGQASTPEEARALVANYKPPQPEKTPAKTETQSSGPNVGDTRTVSAGRGQGTKTQVYKVTGRGGVNTEWVDK